MTELEEKQYALRKADRRKKVGVLFAEPNTQSALLLASIWKSYCVIGPELELTNDNAAELERQILSSRDTLYAIKKNFYTKLVRLKMTFFLDRQAFFAKINDETYFLAMNEKDLDECLEVYYNKR